jgi:hypothetical protein
MPRILSLGSGASPSLGILLSPGKGDERSDGPDSAGSPAPQMRHTLKPATEHLGDGVHASAVFLVEGEEE